MVEHQLLMQYKSKPPFLSAILSSAVYDLGDYGMLGSHIGEMFVPGTVHTDIFVGCKFRVTCKRSI